MFPCFLNVFATMSFRILIRFSVQKTSFSMRQGPPCRAAGWPGTSCTAALRDAIGNGESGGNASDSPFWIHRWYEFVEGNSVKKHLDIFVIKVLIPCSASLSWKSWKLVLFAPGHGIAFCCALKSTRTWLLLLKAQNSWTISFSDEATATCRDVRKSYCKLDKNLFFSREEKIQHDKDVAKCCCKHM